MKKFGFTLAEVLTTLTVVGVVATLTLPNIMGKANTTAHAGPKLAKFATSFDQANISLMEANSIDRISDLTTSVQTYIDELGKYLKITSQTTVNDGNNKKIPTIILKDGTAAIIAYNPASITDKTKPAYQQKLGDIHVDIDGIETTRGYGKDRFSFTLWNDGSLRPKGAAGWDGTDASKPGGTDPSKSTHWKDKCPINGTVSDYSYCTGHIFENNLKILYK